MFGRGGCGSGRCERGQRPSAGLSLRRGGGLRQPGVRRPRRRRKVSLQPGDPPCYSSRAFPHCCCPVIPWKYGTSGTAPFGGAPHQRGRRCSPATGIASHKCAAEWPEWVGIPSKCSHLTSITDYHCVSMLQTLSSNNDTTLTSGYCRKSG